MRVCAWVVSPSPLRKPLSLACVAHTRAEAIVRGHKSGLLTVADYNNLTQCEALDDIKLNLVRPTYSTVVGCGGSRGLCDTTVDVWQSQGAHGWDVVGVYGHQQKGACMCVRPVLLLFFFNAASANLIPVALPQRTPPQPSIHPSNHPPIQHTPPPNTPRLPLTMAATWPTRRPPCTPQP